MVVLYERGRVRRVLIGCNEIRVKLYSGNWFFTFFRVWLTFWVR